jgi:hypothetical protein
VTGGGGGGGKEEERRRKGGTHDVDVVDALKDLDLVVVRDAEVGEYRGDLLVERGRLRDRHREVEAPQRLVDLFGEPDLPRATAAEHGEEAPGGGVGTATE